MYGGLTCGGGIHVQLQHMVINVWRINVWRGHSRGSCERVEGHSRAEVYSRVYKPPE